MANTTRSENYLPSFFNRIFDNDLVDWNTNNFTSPDASLPAVNVKETDDDYLIELAAPGMKKEDFRINFQNNVLTISSEKEIESESEDGNYSRREFNYKSFQRCFSVRHTDVDSDKISASYKDGILSIKLPKREEVKPKPAKDIKIS